jgi:hypothetical protein
VSARTESPGGSSCVATGALFLNGELCVENVSAVLWTAVVTTPLWMRQGNVMAYSFPLPQISPQPQKYESDRLLTCALDESKSP